MIRSAAYSKAVLAGMAGAIAWEIVALAMRFGNLCPDTSSNSWKQELDHAGRSGRDGTVGYP